LKDGMQTAVVRAKVAAKAGQQDKCREGFYDMALHKWQRISCTGEDIGNPRPWLVRGAIVLNQVAFKAFIT
jgi:hypothetical protein